MVHLMQLNERIRKVSEILFVCLFAVLLVFCMEKWLNGLLLFYQNRRIYCVNADEKTAWLHRDHDSTSAEDGYGYGPDYGKPISPY